MRANGNNPYMIISIHALREEGDQYSSGRYRTEEGISIHALREEGDIRQQKSHRSRANFYPRPPRGGRLCAWLLPCSTFSFLSTPSARRATAAGIYKNPKQRISIHALREEGDMEPEFTLHCSALFLSTPSARRATKPEGAKGLMRLNFYPRPPRGGRPAPGKGHHRRSDISIHALREEGDPKQ